MLVWRLRVYVLISYLRWRREWTRFGQLVWFVLWLSGIAGAWSDGQGFKSEDLRNMWPSAIIDPERASDLIHSLISHGILHPFISSLLFGFAHVKPSQYLRSVECLDSWTRSTTSLAIWHVRRTSSSSNYGRLWLEHIRRRSKHLCAYK